MTQAVTLSGLGSTAPIINSPVLTAPVLGTPASGSLVNCTDVNYTGFKNRIINGGMVIDQRNAGASVTPTSGAIYTCDRWNVTNSQASKLSVQQNASAVTPPTGFSSYLGVTSLSSYSVLAGDYFLLVQSIEGYNVSDLDFGKASAKTVTVSFWVRSSLTGTFGGALNNSGSVRCYPFTYTINSANTWEQKTITVVGDTTGTWLTNNGIGLIVIFGLGVGTSSSSTAGSWQTTNFYSATGATSVVGTSGATFYITGVQLEKGSVATSFDYRPYGTELSLCQRYYEYLTVSIQGGYFATANYCGATWLYKVTKRAAPIVVLNTGSTTTVYSNTDGVSVTNGNSVTALITAGSTAASEL